MSRRSKKKPLQNLQRKSAAGIAPANPDPGGKWTVAGICILLAALVCAVFGQTLRHAFVNYDDNMYVSGNPHVAGGLNLKSILWAFTHPELFLWTPLTTISHMLDCQIYGLKPWGHHLTNVLLHGMSVIALFLALRQMTGAPWRCAFVAAVFAIHPLRAESVAWVAERKDVLSGLFFMLTLWAYVNYARRRSVARYLPVIFLFALGLMAKQMVVTLPCVLLLLDYWPLGRFAQPPDSPPGRVPVFVLLAVEKLPLFALSIASCAQTLLIGRGLRTVAPVAHPFLLRAANALVCYVVYIFQMAWPAGLAVYYPYPPAVPAWEALGAVALLAGISIAAIAWRRKHPAFLTGWFWYVGMMAPVIGFIPLGREGHADRYTYLPQIGLYIAVAWMCADACARLRLPRLIPAASMGLAVAVLGLCAHTQVSYWRNDESLWSHVLEVMPDNAFAHNSLGLDLASDGDADGAIAHYREALAVQPDYPEARTNMGNALFDKGDVEGAIVQYEEALKTNPRYPDAHNNLGHALLQNGQVGESIAECRKALAIDPDYVEALNNLGNALATNRELDEAIIQYQKAIKIKPDHANAHRNLAIALLHKGRVDEAVAEFQSALQIDPHDPDIQNNLAHVLATCPQAALRNGALAVELAREANQSTGGRNPVVLGTLAAAYAETGQFSDAVETAQLALELADSRSNAGVANALRTQIALYQSGKPFRDESLGK